MEILNSKICQQHKLQANIMCTKDQCFHKSDILVCKQCLPKHSQHQNYMIQVALLNQKVHQLMKKRMEFQIFYQKSCDEMVNELKKFKMFKQQIVNILNFRQRCLNEACKKIRKNIPYQKDKHLFKNHLGYVYLAMKGINPNIDLYRNFKTSIIQTMNQCHKALHKFQLNIKQVPMLNIKDHQICSILKKAQQQSISPIVYFHPKFKQFKKQSLKINPPNINNDWKIQRLNKQEFITYSKDLKYAKWYDANNFHYPKILPIGANIHNMQILSKNAYATDNQGMIVIYDLLNEKIIKEYASTNHKNASISKLLTLPSHNGSNYHILHFITNPNQIVCLNYDDERISLKMIKGVETKQRCINAALIQDKFIASFSDKVVRLYNNQQIQQESEFQCQGIINSIASIDQNTYVVGGQTQYIGVYDIRIKKLVLKLQLNSESSEIKKLYSNTVMSIHDKTLKIFDIKAQKQIFSSKSDEYMNHLEILDSANFVTSGKHLTLWNGLS